jgi:flagellar assembly factor FliW
MEIKTKYAGDVTMEDTKILHFPVWLPGFADEREFVLLDLPGNTVFQILQSIRSENVAFIVTNPYHFYQDYTFELDDNSLDSLQLDAKKDVLVFSIVTLKDPFANSTLNLKAPVMINTAKKRGKQYILMTDEYPSKASIVLPATGKGKGSHHACTDTKAK